MSKLHITHLVMSGGGMHGVMFVGALRYLYLEKLHINITHISATSIGSYIGLMVAFKFTIEEIEKVMYKCFDNPNFNCIPRKHYLKLVTELGVCSTSYIIEDLKSVVKNKYPDIDDDISFKELAKRFGVNMYISTTNINKCENTIFSIESTPDVSVFKACEASMSIPFLYKPVYVNGEYHYDGGLSNNFPIKVFANVPKENIIGMILYKESKQSAALSNENINLIVITKQILNMMNVLRVKEVLFRQIEEKDHKYYYIPDNIPLENFMSIKFSNLGIQFDITVNQINDMIFAGFESMHTHIEKRVEMLKVTTENRLKDIENL